VQPSYSYISVVEQLQKAGWVVVAPVTDVFDVVGRDIGVPIDQKRADIKLQSTLQVGAVLVQDALMINQQCPTCKRRPLQVQFSAACRPTP